MELLDYVESEARSTAAFHITNADNLTKESNTLLNLLLAGAGGALALVATLLQKTVAVPGWQIWAVGSAAIYLFLIAAIVVWKCLWVQPIWPPSNEPKNFPLAGLDITELRKFELENRQRCIDLNRERNERIALWLNLSRAFAAATPVLTVFVAVVAAKAA